MLTAAILARFTGRGVTMLTGWVILRAFFSGFGANILNNIPISASLSGFCEEHRRSCADTLAEVRNHPGRHPSAARGALKFATHEFKVPAIRVAARCLR